MGWTPFEIQWGQEFNQWNFKNSAGEVFPMTLQSALSVDNEGRFISLPAEGNLEDGELFVAKCNEVFWGDVRILNSVGTGLTPTPPDYAAMPYEIVMGRSQTDILCQRINEGLDPIGVRYFFPNMAGTNNGEEGEIRIISFFAIGGWTPCVCDGVNGWWSIVYYFWV